MFQQPVPVQELGREAWRKMWQSWMCHKEISCQSIMVSLYSTFTPFLIIITIIINIFRPEIFQFIIKKQK